jgi:hypothetical protein
MALQNNNLMLLDADGSPRTIDTANDSIGIAVDTDFAADVSVGGNFHVTGDIISGGTRDVIVTDNFLDLNNGNATSDMAGGFTVNIKAASTQDMTGGSGVTFTAQAGGAEAFFQINGVNPSSLSLAVGDIIEISGLVQAAGNMGLFVVNDIEDAANGKIKIEKANNSRTPFCQTNFEDDTEDAGVLAWDLALSVICVSNGTLNAAAGTVPKGIFCTAYNVAATKDNLVYESAQAVSMQESYNVGSAITMANPGSGDIVIKTDDAVGSRADFKLQLGAGANYLSTSANGIALGSGSAAGRIALDGEVSTDIIFDGVGLRKIEQDGQNITMQTVNAGAVAVSAAGNLSLTSNGNKFDLVGATAQDDCSVDAQFNVDANNKTLLIRATNAFGGKDARVEVASDGNVDVIADQEVLIQAKGTGANSLVVQSSLGHATFEGKLSTTIKALTNNLTMSGEVNASLTSVTGNTIIDSTAGLVQSTAQTGHRLTSTSGGFEIDATAGGFSIDAAAGASNVTATGSPLTLSTITSGNVNLTSAAEIVATAATNATLKSTVGLAKLEAASGAATVMATGKITIASSATDLDIDASTSIAIDSGAATTLTAGTDLLLQTTLGHASLKAFGAGKDAQVFSNAADVQIGAALGASVTAQGAALSINHTHAGATQLTVNSTGTGATDAISVNASVGGMSLQGKTQARVASSDGNVVIQSTLAKVLIDAVTDSEFKTTGAAAVLSIKSTDAAGEVEIAASAIGLDGFVEYINPLLGSGIEYTATGGGIAAGDVCYILNNAGNSEAGKATNTNTTHMPVGLAVTAAAAGASGTMHTVCGVPVATTLGITDANRGQFVFLGATGALTLTAPTASGTTVWRLGTVVDRNAGNAVILWNPQYVSKRP